MPLCGERSAVDTPLNDTTSAVVADAPPILVYIFLTVESLLLSLIYYIMSLLLFIISTGTPNYFIYF
jgi:hypothetical protein